MSLEETVALPERRVTVHTGDSTLREPKVPWQECFKMDERLRFVARLLGD